MGPRISLLTSSVRLLIIPLARSGICMDLNPWEFEAGFEAFELARFCRANKIDVLALPQAWLRPETPGPNADEPYHGLVNYWLTRATPLLASVEKPTLVVYANRTGEERGESCVHTTRSESRSRTLTLAACRYDVRRQFHRVSSQARRKRAERVRRERGAAAVL